MLVLCVTVALGILLTFLCPSRASPLLVVRHHPLRASLPRASLLLLSQTSPFHVSRPHPPRASPSRASLLILPSCLSPDLPASASAILPSPASLHVAFPLLSASPGWTPALLLLWLHDIPPGLHT